MQMLTLALVLVVAHPCCCAPSVSLLPRGQLYGQIRMSATAPSVLILRARGDPVLNRYGFLWTLSVLADPICLLISKKWRVLLKSSDNTLDWIGLDWIWLAMTMVSLFWEFGYKVPVPGWYLTAVEIRNPERTFYHGATVGPYHHSFVILCRIRESRGIRREFR